MLNQIKRHMAKAFLVLVALALNLLWFWYGLPFFWHQGSGAAFRTGVGLSLIFFLLLLAAVVHNPSSNKK